MKPSRDRGGDNRSETAGRAATAAKAREAGPRPIVRREGPPPRENLPLILEVAPNEDYVLLDSGGGEKLEQYGPYRIVRPEGQAIWQKALPAHEWLRADAVFTGNTDEEGMGRWRFPKAPLGETWPMRHDGIDYLGRFTSFRHVGVFPEQASHWDFMEGLIRAADRPVKALNLFARRDGRRSCMQVTRTRSATWHRIPRRCFPRNSPSHSWPRELSWFFYGLSCRLAWLRLLPER